MTAPSFAVCGYDVRGTFGVIAEAASERAALAAYRRAKDARARYVLRVAWYRARDGTLLELRPFALKTRH